MTKITLDASVKGKSVSLIMKPITITLDPSAMTKKVGDAAATTIRANIIAGRAPDGGTMPPLAKATVAKKHGEPRGVRTGRLVGSIRAVPDGAGGHVVTADEESPGQLARALGGTPLAIDPQAEAMQQAFRDVAAGMVSK